MQAWLHLSWLQPFAVLLAVIVTYLPCLAWASIGDQLPEFQHCVELCKEVNCKDGDSVLPVHLRLLLWTCASECDYTCQHIITDQRRAALAPPSPPLEPESAPLKLEPKPKPKPQQPVVVQFHGKWPFRRVLGVQEPCSVLFSLLNLLAHRHGVARVRAAIPAGYALRPFYLAFGYIGMASWVCSMVFHTRDFRLTERADYFAAGANVLYGLYYALVRIFRLDQQQQPQQQLQLQQQEYLLAATTAAGAGGAVVAGGTAAARKALLLRLWTLLCVALYAAHVAYLTLWRWDYGYNMAANVAAGVLQNVLWSWFSVRRYRRFKKPWAAWPGLIVAWVVLAMSFELLDFPPLGGFVDAHSLWHLGTVLPTIWWYNFLIRDAEEDIQGMRLKA